MDMALYRDGANEQSASLTLGADVAEMRAPPKGSAIS
jgi:hypothetical protein